MIAARVNPAPLSIPSNLQLLVPANGAVVVKEAYTCTLRTLLDLELADALLG